MKSCEKLISSISNYYNYSPSVDAKHTFFYPICTGHFIYEAGYHQHRNSFDSFLLMYIQKGEVQVKLEDTVETATANHFVLLDCYRPHGYQTATAWECIWFHFDGPMARKYYELIVSHTGTVFSVSDSYPIVHNMELIYKTFQDGNTIREALFSKQITDILTALLMHNRTETNASSNSISMEEIMSHINENFTQSLSIEDLADKAMLSPYHFIRMFKKETGFTPHEYLINTRISNAKYLLKNSHMSIKDICFNTGFSSESVFCTSFKKKVGVTPATYRASI